MSATPLTKSPRSKTDVRIYRAVPADVTEIRPSDWVALDATYVAAHAEAMAEWEGRDWHVLERIVAASDVEWAGSERDEWYIAEGEKREFIYQPRRVTSTDPTTLERQRRAFDWAIHYATTSVMDDYEAYAAAETARMLSEINPNPH